jgi:hypothetical protein
MFLWLFGKQNTWKTIHHMIHTYTHDTYVVHVTIETDATYIGMYVAKYFCVPLAFWKAKYLENQPPTYDT